jgi:hypothetical protein
MSSKKRTIARQQIRNATIEGRLEDGVFYAVRAGRLHIEMMKQRPSEHLLEFIPYSKVSV